MWLFIDEIVKILLIFFISFFRSCIKLRSFELNYALSPTNSPVIRIINCEKIYIKKKSLNGFSGITWITDSTPDDDASSRTYLQLIPRTMRNIMHLRDGSSLDRATRAMMMHEETDANHTDTMVVVAASTVATSNEWINFVIFQSDFKCFLLQHDMTNTH